MKIILSQSRLKEILKNKFNFDLESRVKKITEYDELPEDLQIIKRAMFHYYLSVIPGVERPFYLIDNEYLYHGAGPKEELVKLNPRKNDFITVSIEELREKYNMPNIGLPLSEILDVYVD